MPEVITNNDAQYALDMVRAICTEVGPGLPGSSQERERAAIIRKELESHLGAGNVVIEGFSVAPGAFLSPLPALSMLAAALLNTFTGRLAGISPWLTTVLALALSIIASLLFVLEFILGFEMVDPLFKKKQSVNVIGTLRQSGTEDVKRLLILSGHHDSAPENTWLRFLGYGFFVLTATFFIGLIALLAMSIIQLKGMITGNADLVRFGTLGCAGLSGRAFHCLRVVLYPGRERWRNRTGRGG